MYSTNFDQCHVTKNHKGLGNRQQKRSPLCISTDYQQFSSFNRRLNIKHSLNKGYLFVGFGHVNYQKLSIVK